MKPLMVFLLGDDERQSSPTATDRFTLADVVGYQEAQAVIRDSAKADLEHLHPLPGVVV